MNSVLGAIAAAAPAIAMLAVFALILGGIHLLRRGAEKQKGWLMIALAFIILANVLIWTL